MYPKSRLANYPALIFALMSLPAPVYAGNNLYELNILSAIGQKLRCEVRFSAPIVNGFIREVSGSDAVKPNDFKTAITGNTLLITSDHEINEPVINLKLEISEKHRKFMVPVTLVLPLSEVVQQASRQKSAQINSVNSVKFKLLQDKLNNLSVIVAEKEHKLAVYFYSMSAMALSFLLFIWFALKYKTKLENKAPAFAVEDFNQSEDYLFDIARIYIEEARTDEARKLLKRLVNNPEPVISNQARKLLDELDE